MPPEGRDGPGQPMPDRASNLFSVPAPIKRVFDRYPLTTYPANDLPRRADTNPDRNKLFVFTDTAGAKYGRPSFNPQCLKWQAYLKFVGIDFDIVASNNHASPTGALPFLIPALPVGSQIPIPSSKVQKWAIEEAHCEEEQQLNTRFEAYASLLDNRLYTLYLDSDNFSAVARRLYVNPATTNCIVRTALAFQLQQAARDELHRSSQYIDANDLIAEAGDAFEALSTLLGEDQYFYGRPKPGLFDASVFAYTHLILDEGMGWKHDALGRLLKKHENLVQHRNRLLELFER